MMISRAFRPVVVRLVSSEVSLAPVRNILTSFSLLNVAGETLSEVDPWVGNTAAALTEEQRYHNLLVFEGLGEALILEQMGESFPAYLDQLAAEAPTALQGRILDHLGQLQPSGADAGAPALTPAMLLADEGRFVAYVTNQVGGGGLDQRMVADLYRLLNDPATMQKLIVSHLRFLWDTFLATYWKNQEHILRGMVHWLQRRPLPPAPAAETIRTVIGRELPREISTQLEGVTHIVFVLSPHIGVYASRFGSLDTLWVFVRARRDVITRVRLAPVKRVELVGPLAVLADETRLQILELTAQHGQLLAQELITRLALSQSSVSRHLKQLVATGFLLEERGEGANKSYRLDSTRIDWLFRGLNALLSGAASAESTTPQAALPEGLERFLDAEGRVTSWPAKLKDQSPLLAYLITQFETGRDYTEREVNELIKAWHTYNDPATLRRALCEDGLLKRTSDGRRYWRAETTPEVEPSTP